jgi:toxin ParE1/3/4
MPRIVYSPGAKADLNEIWDYIAADNRLAADRLAEKFDDTFFLLAHNPHFGRLRDEIAEDIRALPVGRYLIMYRVIPAGVDIVRVVHGARDLKNLKLT